METLQTLQVAFHYYNAGLSNPQHEVRPVVVRVLASGKKIQYNDPNSISKLFDCELDAWLDIRREHATVVRKLQAEYEEAKIKWEQLQLQTSNGKTFAQIVKDFQRTSTCNLFSELISDFYDGWLKSNERIIAESKERLDKALKYLDNIDYKINNLEQ